MPKLSHQHVEADDPGRLLAEEPPEVAAHQVGVLFALAGVLALVAIPLHGDQEVELLVIATADLGAAGLAWWLPWRRWHRHAPLLLSLPALATLGFSTWAFGGFATGTGPFFVLLFAWIGLHFPTWAIAAVTPPAAVAYVAPLVATHQPAQVVSSAVIILPILVGVAMIIAGQVARQREARQQLYRMERWRAALTSMLAHDVRSPLAAVHLALGTLQAEHGRLSAERREAIIAAALRQAVRIGRLAAGLLDMERVDIRGGLSLDLHEVRLRQAIDEAIGFLDTGDIVIEADHDLVVVADPQRLEQILVNLTTNALRHGTPPVVISGQCADDVVRISVRDHGPGVPRHQQPHLFTRFNRPDRSDSSSDSSSESSTASITASSPDSAGLGLWIVRELARAHNGEVSYSDASPGARFTVTLPTRPRGHSRN